MVTMTASYVDIPSVGDDEIDAPGAEVSEMGG